MYPQKSNRKVINSLEDLNYFLKKYIQLYYAETIKMLKPALKEFCKKNPDYYSSDGEDK